MQCSPSFWGSFSGTRVGAEEVPPLGRAREVDRALRELLYQLCLVAEARAWGKEEGSSETPILALDQAEGLCYAAFSLCYACVTLVLRGIQLVLRGV